MRDPIKNYAIVKRWRKANPEKLREQTLRYRAKHPETMQRASVKYLRKHKKRLKVKWRVQARVRRRADPEGNRRRLLAFKQRQYAKLIVLAGRDKPGLCEVCNELHIRIVYDHDHESGAFRGWICDRCNRVLGLAYDNPTLLRALANYLDLNNVQVQKPATGGLHHGLQ